MGEQDAIRAIVDYAKTARYSSDYLMCKRANDLFALLRSQLEDECDVWLHKQIAEAVHIARQQWDARLLSDDMVELVAGMMMGLVWDVNDEVLSPAAAARVILEAIVAAKEKKA